MFLGITMDHVWPSNFGSLGTLPIFQFFSEQRPIYQQPMLFNENYKRKVSPSDAIEKCFIILTIRIMGSQEIKAGSGLEHHSVQLLHLPEEQYEAQRSEMTCPRSHRRGARARF